MQTGSIAEALRRAIVESGLTFIALERATGVQRASIARFMRRSQSLRLDKADALAAFFGLELRPKRKGR